MIICCISDTHGIGLPDEIPECDVLVHAGDITMNGEKRALIRINQWCSAMKARRLIRTAAICIAGNHDWCFQDARRLDSIQMLSEWTYLEDSDVVIDAVKFYGSPWTPDFLNWAFMKRRGPEMAAAWAKIPDDTRVLVTHGPPFGVLDFVPGGGHVGCEELTMLLRFGSRLSALALHIFGHIHEGYGRQRFLGRSFINASLLDGDYVPSNRPILVEV